MGEALGNNPEIAQPSKKTDLETKILAPKRGPETSKRNKEPKEIRKMRLRLRKEEEKAARDAKRQEQREASLGIKQVKDQIEAIQVQPGDPIVNYQKSPHKETVGYEEKTAQPKTGLVFDKYSKMAGENPSLKLDWSKLEQAREKTLERRAQGKEVDKEAQGKITQLHRDVITGLRTDQTKQALQKSEGMHGDIAAWNNLPQEEPVAMPEMKVDESVARENAISRMITGLGDRWNAWRGKKYMEVAEPTAPSPTAGKKHKFETLSELDAAPTKDEIRMSAQEARDAEKGETMDSKIDKMGLDNEEETIPSARDLVASAQKMEKEGKRKSTLMRMEAGNAIQGDKNMDAINDSLEKINSQMTELQPIITSTKIGWFSTLKINNEGYITNLPLQEEAVLIDKLVKQKEKLGAKGKVEEANKIVDQIEALEKYPDLLLQRDKLMPN